MLVPEHQLEFPVPLIPRVRWHLDVGGGPLQKLQPKLRKLDFSVSMPAFRSAGRHYVYYLKQ